MTSLLIWLPLLGAALLQFLPEKQIGAIKGLALLTSLATLILCILRLGNFDGTVSRVQGYYEYLWIPGLGVGYRVGLDGISIWLVVLSALIGFVAVAYSQYVKNRLKLYLGCILLLETALIGCFCSLDLILFYTFFELSIAPMYFLISVWGGPARRAAAAKFFIYTFAGSIFMLVGMIVMAYLNYNATHEWTFSLITLQHSAAAGTLWANAPTAEKLIFWSFAIAFLVKAPAFPFHGWIADTYAEGPVTAAMLSSVMVKMGTFGILRFCLPLFPDVVGSQLPWLSALAVVGILYGAVLATIQTDIRRTLAYSSVSHMGFLLLGIFSMNLTGLVGGAYQQLNHAITATALFVLVGFLIERRGTSSFAEFGGLKARMPMFATLFLISMLASVGLPGLNGFVGEFLSMLGAFESGYFGLYGLNVALVVFAGLGVVLGAGYLLYLYQQIFYGDTRNPLNNRLKDIKPWESSLVGGLVLIMIVGGLAPNIFTRDTEASLRTTIQMAINPAGTRPQMTTDSIPEAKVAIR